MSVLQSVNIAVKLVLIQLKEKILNLEVINYISSNKNDTSFPHILQICFVFLLK